MTLLVVTLVLLAVAGTAHCDGFRLYGGWTDAGDGDSAFGLGIGFLRDTLMADLNFFDTDFPKQGAQGSFASLVTDLSVSYLWRPAIYPQAYYGGGVDYLQADDLGAFGYADDSSLGFHIVAGTRLPGGSRWGALFAEARYLFATDLEGKDLDGLQLKLGVEF